MKRFILFCFFVSILSGVFGQRTITIGILNDKRDSGSDDYLEQLKNNVTSIVGEETTVIFDDVLYNDFDLERAKENYHSLLSGQTDIIISFGVVNTIMLYKEKDYPKATIVVGAINNDFVDVPENQITSGINNLTYLITPFSYKDDLDAFSTLINYKKIGIVVDQYMLDLLPIEKLFNEYFLEKEADYEVIPLSSNSNLKTIFNDVDAVYLVSTSGLNDTEIKQTIDIVNGLKLPSLSGHGIKDVEHGILATNQPEINFNQIFRRIALNVESIIGGTNASELPLHVNYRKQLSVNLSTADQIGFAIRNSMLARVNLIEGTPVDGFGIKYSMLDIMTGVIEENLSLNAERKNINLSEQDVKGAKSQFLPDINANVSGAYLDPEVAKISNGQNPEFSTAGNLSLQQVVYSEEAAANVSIQKSLLASQQENLNASQLDLMLNAAIAYYNALILKTNLSIQNKNLQLTKQNLEIADQNFEIGASGKSDVLRFRSQMAQNTRGLIEARNSLGQAYFQINQLLNQPINEKIDVKDTIIDNSFNGDETYKYLLETMDDPGQKEKLTRFLIDEAKRNAPELKNIGFNMDVTQRMYRLNNAGRFIPTVAFQGQYNYTFSKSGAGSTLPTGYPGMPDGTYNLGLNLSLPVFQQNTRNINRQTALIQEDQLNIQKEDIVLSIEKNINDLLLDLTNQVANIEISKIDLDFSKESLALSQNEYQNGAIPVIQLIDAQNNYFQAQLASSNAKYNFEIVLMQLQRALGYFIEMNLDSENENFTLRAKQYILTNN